MSIFSLVIILNTSLSQQTVLFPTVIQFYCELSIYFLFNSQLALGQREGGRQRGGGGASLIDEFRFWEVQVQWKCVRRLLIIGKTTQGRAKCSSWMWKCSSVCCSAWQRVVCVMWAARLSNLVHWLCRRYNNNKKRNNNTFCIIHIIFAYALRFCGPLRRLTFSVTYLTLRLVCSFFLAILGFLRALFFRGNQ